jgi:hypothetical protein
VAGRADAFRWTVALLSVGFILGAYIDAASRLVTPSPLAPWNDLFMDAAWLAVTAFMAVVFWRALARGAAWRSALPPGYHLALVGGIVFGLGALADVYYQIAFGFGTGLEALLAPTHLVELAGGGLLVAAPLSQALKDRPERVDWPIVLAAALTLSALTFFTQYAHPLVDLWSSHRWTAQVASWVAQDLGVVAIEVQVSLLVGVILLLVRSFRVPRGSLTAVCGPKGLCMAIVSRHPELLWVPLLTGVAADLLLLRVRPMDASATGLRLFAAGVPALWTALYWTAIVLVEVGTVWSPQLWVGVVLAAALAGFLVSYLAGIRRPRSVVAGEIWGDRWPQRHVEVSPAVVKEALDVLDDGSALAASPLARLACISAEGTAAGPELRGLLVDVVRELAAARPPRDAEAGQLLVDYYVKRVGSHEVIAERLHLSRPTFYRRLQRGLTLTAERLDELAEFAARHG